MGVVHIQPKLVITGVVCRMDKDRFYVRNDQGGIDSYSLRYYRLVDLTHLAVKVK